MSYRCPICGDVIGNDLNKEFRDDLSRKEFSISGMCQHCQDITFMESETDD